MAQHVYKNMRKITSVLSRKNLSCGKFRNNEVMECLQAIGGKYSQCDDKLTKEQKFCQYLGGNKE